MDSIQIQPKDLKYLSKDPSFNPARNKGIIDETVRETEKFFYEIRAKDRNDEENRVDVMSSFARYKFHDQKRGDLRQFLGPEHYNKLVGERTRDKVRSIESLNKLGDKKIII